MVKVGPYAGRTGGLARGGDVGAVHTQRKDQGRSRKVAAGRPRRQVSAQTEPAPPPLILDVQAPGP